MVESRAKAATMSQPISTTDSSFRARIAIVGLGYVGLPPAVEFGKKHDVVGYDVDAGRVEELRRGFDRTKETSAEAIAAARGLRFTADAEELRERDFFIVCVPTPVDTFKIPDLRPLRAASKAIGERMPRGASLCTRRRSTPA